MPRCGLAFGFVLICSGCVAAPAPVVTQLTMTTPPNSPACRDYTLQATVQGTPQTIVGHACQQPDGSWRVVEGVQGQAGQVVTTNAPPPYAYDPYYDPWLWAPPLGLSVGAFVFVDRHRHFHSLHASPRFVGGGFGHGMGHGLRHFGPAMHG